MVSHTSALPTKEKRNVRRSRVMKPMPYNHERNGECMQGEAQSLEYFRYARNQSFVAESIRERLNTHNAELKGGA